MFYLMQYSLSNLNAFILLIGMGFSLYYYVNDNKEYKDLLDKNNSPIQLIRQIRGLFNINPFLSLSFSITIFSFVGIPPLIGFFAKQMVLSAALDSGYVFLTLIAILTSVISAVYYLNIIKQVFFDKSEYKINPILKNMDKHASISKNNVLRETIIFKYNNIVLSSSLTLSISLLTLIIILFSFDLDINLIYPYYVIAYTNTIYGLIIMLIFFLALTLGFAFELGKHALKIDSRQMLILTSKQSNSTTCISSINIY